MQNLNTHTQKLTSVYEKVNPWPSSKTGVTYLYEEHLDVVVMSSSLVIKKLLKMYKKLRKNVNNVCKMTIKTPTCQLIYTYKHTCTCE